MMRTLNNRELIVISRRIGLSILLFAALRVFGSLIDEHFLFEYPYFSTLATYGFWMATYAFFWYHRKILQSDEVGHEGRANISKSVDNIAEEMKRFSRKLDRAIGQ